MSINIGIIGTGMIANMHAESLLKIPEAELYWVSDLDQQKMDAFRKKFHVKYSSVDYRHMLEDDGLDAVIVSTPPASHVSIFQDCLKAGKHCLLEKPPAIREEDLAILERGVEAHPELILAGCSSRHSRLQPKFRFVEELISSGQLGDIYYIHHNAVARNGRPGIEYHPEAKWFLDRSIAGGGPMIDWGLYDLSFHLGLLGDRPELIDVEASFTQSGLDKVDVGGHVYDVEEHFMAVMSFNNGLKYYWERAAHAHMEASNQTRIYGSRGGMRLSYCTWEDPEVEIFTSDGLVSGKEIEKIDVSSQDDVLELLRDFTRAISASSPPAMSLSLELKHLRIIQHIYRACGLY